MEGNKKKKKARRISVFALTLLLTLILGSVVLLVAWALVGNKGVSLADVTVEGETVVLPEPKKKKTAAEAKEETEAETETGTGTDEGKEE